MEKKVYLKDLVEFGSNTRKQITSKVRVSDQGVYPIGEIWDANTVVDVIVNGAHEQHDTLRELDQLAHSTLNQLLSEITRAKAAEQQIREYIGDLGMRYTEASTEYDYIHDEESWNDSYQNGGLKLYYTKNPDEDRWNVQENRPARATDKNPDGSWDDTKCPQCWQGAINAPGAAYPWIVPHFDRDVNSKLIFRYAGKDDIKPWGDIIFGIGEGKKQWGCASIPSEFNDQTLNLNADNGFDIDKFQMILEYVEPILYTVKTYVEDHSGSGVGYSITGKDIIGSEQIIDGSVSLDDLSQDIKDKLRATVDESEENVNIPGL